MSSTFTGIPTRDYIGQPFVVPIVQCVPPGKSPRAVPLTIDWNVYWQAAGNVPNLGVRIDLSLIAPDAMSRGNFPQGDVQIDAIRSVKIDNTFSSCPIYLLFPDTGDIVTCSPQTIVTVPVLTSGKTLYVYITGMQAGFIPLTKIWLMNVTVEASIDQALQLTFPQWLGSPVIQRANAITPGYAPPALGDQTIQVEISLVNSNTQLVLPAQASGFYYLTAVCFNVLDNFAVSPVGSFRDLCILETVALNVIHRYRWLVPSLPNPTTGDQNAIQAGVKQIYNQSGLQIRIPATGNVQLAYQSQGGPAATGLGQLYVTYTYNTN